MTTTVISHQKYIRLAPRKVRLVAGLVRDAKVNQALTTLSLTPKRAAKTIHQVITQAKANAVNNHQLREDSLVVKGIQIDGGPVYKRWRPVSRGRAHPILKRSSHIKITLSGEPAQSKK